MSSKENLAHNLRKILERRYLTQKSYAKITNISLSTLQNVLAGGNVTLDTLDEIARGAGIQPWELIKEGKHERS